MYSNNNFSNNLFLKYTFLLFHNSINHEEKIIFKYDYNIMLCQNM